MGTNLINNKQKCNTNENYGCNATTFELLYLYMILITIQKKSINKFQPTLAMVFKHCDHIDRYQTIPFE
jgi:hypothetical protein